MRSGINDDFSCEFVISHGKGLIRGDNAEVDTAAGCHQKCRDARECLQWEWRVYKKLDDLRGEDVNRLENERCCQTPVQSDSTVQVSRTRS